MEKYIREIIDKEAAMSEEEQPLFHTNCAENLFTSADRKYNLGVEERFLQAIIPYGAGMQTGNTCGALLGSLAAFGMLYGEPKPTENKKMKAAVSKYVELFEETFHSLKCSEVKPAFMDEAGSCTPVKVQAGKLFDYVVENFDEIYREYLVKEAQPDIIIHSLDELPEAIRRAGE